MLLLNGVAVLSLLLAYAAAAFTPETMGYFSLFGLAYPFSLLANLVFIFYWYFKKRRFALISLSFIMLGVNHLTAFFQISTSGSVDQDAHQIKVLTYNVHVFDVFDKKEGAATRDAIYDLLHREQADVVCFQEFYQSEKSKSYPTRDTLIEFLPSKYYHERYTHAIGGQQYFGVVTLSKYPIVRHTKWMGADMLEDSRLCGLPAPVALQMHFLVDGLCACLHHRFHVDRFCHSLNHNPPS